MVRGTGSGERRDRAPGLRHSSGRACLAVLDGVRRFGCGFPGGSDGGVCDVREGRHDPSDDLEQRREDSTDEAEEGLVDAGEREECPDGDTELDDAYGFFADHVRQGGKDPVHGVFFFSMCAHVAGPTTPSTSRVCRMRW